MPAYVTPTYKPVPGSVHAYLNGVSQRIGGATAPVSFDTGLAKYVFRDAAAGDRCELRYAHLNEPAQAPLIEHYCHEDFNVERTFTRDVDYFPTSGDIPWRMNSNSGNGATVSKAPIYPHLVFNTGDYGSVTCKLDGYAQRVEADVKHYEAQFNGASQFQTELFVAEHTKPREWFTANPQQNFFQYSAQWGGTSVTIYKSQTNRAGNGFSRKTLAAYSNAFPANTTYAHYNDNYGGQRCIFVLAHNNYGLITTTTSGVREVKADGTTGVSSGFGAVQISFQDPGADDVPAYTDVGGRAGINYMGSQKHYLHSINMTSYPRQAA